MPRAIRTDMADYEKRMARAGTVASNTAAQIEQSSNRIGNAQRNMGRQFADVGAQLSGGQSPFTILAQQGPQLADAMADLGGKAGAVASFFAGPWGAALLAAASVAGTLTAAVLAEDDATEKHTKGAKSLTDAINDMTEASKGAIQTSQQAEQQHYNEAAALAAKAEAARVATIRLIQAAKVRLETADRQTNAQGDPEGGVNFGVTAGATQERELTRLNALLKEQNTELQAQYANVRRAAIPRLQREASEATDKAAAATGRYDRALGKLNDRLADGKITPGAYRTELDKLNRTRDAEVAAAGKSERATKADASAKRDAAKAAKEAARAQQELQQTLERIVGKFDPVRSIAIETGKALKDIDMLEMKGALSSVDALTYKLALARDQARAVADAAWKSQEQRWIDVGFNAGDFDGSNVRKQIDRDLDLRQDANDKIAEDFKRKQEDQLHALAGLYEDLFRGGTDAIWSDFKAMGFRIIAETLAKFTLGQINGTGGGFNVGSALQSVGSALGISGARAAGGPVMGGKTYLVGERGPELFRAPSSGTIVPNSRISVQSLASLSNSGLAARSMTEVSAARPGKTTVNQYFTLDARHGITTPQLLQGVNQTIKSEGARAGAASYAQSQQSAPGTMFKYQQLKG
ncbi:phage tail length tape measure family protein [Sphingobium sp. AP49]|uniref:phage tail length tape measure family protein n=1 Tax=Sphingobium sp. AP49 TaxID=1144307 RepID=UPI000568B4D8|nr:phage tail length tape measure family protein [Sphingobium sp. AP49]WHO39132.1 phage tail length tape measure family protein [Sphingobium sp. AP49]